MVEIKELYKTTHGVALADDIRKHYKGDTKNILLALIKGTILIYISYFRKNSSSSLSLRCG